MHREESIDGRLAELGSFPSASLACDPVQKLRDKMAISIRKCHDKEFNVDICSLCLCKRVNTVSQAICAGGIMLLTTVVIINLKSRIHHRASNCLLYVEGASQLYCFVAQKSEEAVHNHCKRV